MSSIWVRAFSFLIFFCLSLASANVAEQKCLQCKFLVETFKAGMRKTEKQHFAGGNTDWEERKLGKFATRWVTLSSFLQFITCFSETRFIEVLESTCKKDVLSDSKDFNSLKDINFKVRLYHQFVCIYFHYSVTLCLRNTRIC